MSEQTVPGPRYVEAMPVDQIVESKNNPRKRFDPASLAELERSIREKGVLSPLLVRPNGHGHEIAAGHRRFRAARAAGLQALPVIVRDMTDLELLEVLVIENDQREDVHPLEEADGYRKLLMPGTGYDVAKVAARVGRSPKYVYDRLKLLDLIPPAQKLFLDDRFTAGHAILLARLKPEDQERALNAEGGRWGRIEGLFQDAHGLPFEDEESGKSAKKDPYAAMKAVSVKEFEGWIQGSVRAEPAAIDPFLFPEAAATVQAHSGDKLAVILITRDYRAGDDVREGGKERVFGVNAWKRADGREKSKSCERSRLGFVACGPGQGEAFLVCVNKEKCDVHYGAEIRARKKRQKAAAAEDKAGSERAQSEARARDERFAAEQRREREESERWKKARPAILEAVAAAVKKAPTGAGGLLANLVVEECGESYRNVSAAVEKLVPRGRSAEDLVRHAAMMVIEKQSELFRAPRDFPKLARAFNVDVRKILGATAPKVQTSAKTEKGGTR